MLADVAPGHPLRATKDHYIPKSKRVGDDQPLIVMACFTCNNLKGDRFPEQWDRYMALNPRWWEPRENGKRMRMPPPKAAPTMPIEHTKYILEHGKKKYKSWVESGCPAQVELRALRPDEPLPIEYDDPKSQAAFESHYRTNRHNLRVPVDYAPPLTNRH
jgi:hypothetical protein